MPTTASSAPAPHPFLRLFLRAFIYAGIALVAGAILYAIGFAVYMAYDLRDFNGMCPPAPPDIPAYPCTRLEYMERMTLGFWALAAHIVILIPWLSMCAILGAGVAIVRSAWPHLRGARN